MLEALQFGLLLSSFLSPTAGLTRPRSIRDELRASQFDWNNCNYACERLKRNWYSASARNILQASSYLGIFLSHYLSHHVLSHYVCTYTSDSISTLFNLQVLKLFFQLSALILKKSFCVYKHCVKAEALTTFLPSSMNIALQVSARHNPQTDKTSLDNAFRFLLELEFKPSQQVLHQCSVLC